MSKWRTFFESRFKDLLLVALLIVAVLEVRHANAEVTTLSAVRVASPGFSVTCDTNGEEIRDTAWDPSGLGVAVANRPPRFIQCRIPAAATQEVRFGGSNLTSAAPAYPASAFYDVKVDKGIAWYCLTAAATQAIACQEVF